MKFQEQRNIFGEIQLFYQDQISGNTVSVNTTEERLHTLKREIILQSIKDLCKWFHGNRNYEISRLELSNHYAYSKLKKTLSQLNENFSRLYERSTLEEVADYVHLHLFPLIMVLAPIFNNQKTVRYNLLTSRLDQLLSLVKEDGICNVKTVKTVKKP